MPLAIVSRNPFVIDDSKTKEIVKTLTSIIAEGLTCDNPDGKLSQHDVEVWVKDFNPLETHICSLEIVVFANDYPERRLDLDKRRDLIGTNIKKLVPNNTLFWVWVLLVPASFGIY